MRIYQWIKYRIPGLVTIALYNDMTIGKYVYVVTPPDYEELSKADLVPGTEPIVQYLRELQLRSYLKVKYQFDLGHNWSSFIDLIYNFGGVNMNPGNKGFKAFTPLEKDATEGLSWDPEDAQRIVYPR